MIVTAKSTPLADTPSAVSAHFKRSSTMHRAYLHTRLSHRMEYVSPEPIMCRPHHIVYPLIGGCASRCLPQSGCPAASRVTA